MTKKEIEELEKKDVKNALVEMKDALTKLREAWIDCDCALGNVYIDCNDYILGSKETEDEYPFHLSFDEMPVVEWIDGAVERIEKELS